MVQLSRTGARPLLRQVNNKPHATDEHHEEDIDTDAEPVSSDDARSKISSSNISSSSRESGGKKPGPKRKPKPGVRVPKSGLWDKGQADRKRRAGAETGDESPAKKRTSTESGSSSFDRGNIWGENDWERRYEKEHGQPKPKPKVKSEAVPNLFTNPRTYAGTKPSQMLQNGHLKKTTFKKSKEVKVDKNKSKKSGFIKPDPLPSSGDESPQRRETKKGLIVADTPPDSPPKRKRLAMPAKVKEEEEEEPTSSSERKSERRAFIIPPRFDDDMPVSSNERNLKMPTLEIKDYKPLRAQDLDPDNSDDDSGLSSAPSESVLASQAYDYAIKEEDLPPSSHEAHCPYCKEAVDYDFLLAFTKNGTEKMGVRRQADFCKAHKLQTAKDVYRDLKYPKIEWDELKTRLEAHRSHLGSILRNLTPSVFRQQLEQRINSGKDRTLMQATNSDAIQGLTPGYFGTRGAKEMSAYIGSTFSSQLRELAPADKLISANGISGFIQAVLVPELAMKLIMEDMYVDEDGARKIMEESIALGDVVNEEEEDEVLRRQTQAHTQSMTQKAEWEDDNDEDMI